MNLIPPIFGRKESQTNHAKRKAWPSELNPCPTPDKPGHHNACYWDVHGRVTKVCNGCVRDRERIHGGRRAALMSFVADASGAMCKS